MVRKIEEKPIIQSFSQSLPVDIYDVDGLGNWKYQGKKLRTLMYESRIPSELWLHFLKEFSTSCALQEVKTWNLAFHQISHHVRFSDEQLYELASHLCATAPHFVNLERAGSTGYQRKKEYEKEWFDYCSFYYAVRSEEEAKTLVRMRIKSFLQAQENPSPSFETFLEQDFIEEAIVRKNEPGRTLEYRTGLEMLLLEMLHLHIQDEAFFLEILEQLLNYPAALRFLVTRCDPSFQKIQQRHAEILSQTINAQWKALQAQREKTEPENDPLILCERSEEENEELALFSNALQVKEWDLALKILQAASKAENQLNYQEMLEQLLLLPDEAEQQTIFFRMFEQKLPSPHFVKASSQRTFSAIQTAYHVHEFFANAPFHNPWDIFGEENSQKIRAYIREHKEVDWNVAPQTGPHCGKTIWWLAATFNEIDIIREKMAESPPSHFLTSPREGNFAGLNVLLAFALHSHWDIVRQLITPLERNSPSFYADLNFSFHYGEKLSFLDLSFDLLSLALDEGQWDIVEDILAKDATVGLNKERQIPGRSSHNRPLLASAAAKGRWDLVKLILQTETKPHLFSEAVRSEKKWTSISVVELAAKAQQWEIVEQLLATIKVNEQGHFVLGPNEARVLEKILRIAAKAGRWEVVERYFPQHPPSIDAPSRFKKKTLLWFTVKAQKWDMAIKMLQAYPQADINIASFGGESAFWHTAKAGRWDIVRLMVAQHPHPHFYRTNDILQKSVFKLAIQAGQWELIAEVMKKYPPQEEMDWQRYTIDLYRIETENFSSTIPLPNVLDLDKTFYLLNWLVFKNCWLIIKNWLQKDPRLSFLTKASANPLDKQLNSLFAHAACNYQWALVRSALQSPEREALDINEIHHCGHTPLGKAILLQQWDIVHAMLELPSQPDINFAFYDGTTLLNLLACQKQWDLVHQAVWKHPCPDIFTPDFLNETTVFDKAIQDKQWIIARDLLIRWPGSWDKLNNEQLVKSLLELSDEKLRHSFIYVLCLKGISLPVDLAEQLNFQEKSATLQTSFERIATLFEPVKASPFHQLPDEMRLKIALDVFKEEVPGMELLPQSFILEQIQARIQEPSVS